MLWFESFSAGTVAVFIVTLAILVVVGVYSMIVWPLTKWDLSNVNPEKCRSGLEYGLILIFVMGSAAGLWCFSGAAFRRGKIRAPLSAQARVSATLPSK